MVVRLVQIHRQLFADHVSFLLHLDGIEGGVQEHIAQHFPEVREVAMPRFRVKAGRLFRGEGVQVSADSFDILGNLPRAPPPRPLKKQVIDKKRNAAELCGFIASADRHPNANAHAGHVRHVRRSNGYTAFVARNFITAFHLKAVATVSGGPTRRKYSRIISTASFGSSLMENRSMSPALMNFPASSVDLIQFTSPDQCARPKIIIGIREIRRVCTSVRISKNSSSVP